MQRNNCNVTINFEKNSDNAEHKYMNIVSPSHSIIKLDTTGINLCQACEATP